MYLAESFPENRNDQSDTPPASVIEGSEMGECSNGTKMVQGNHRERSNCLNEILHDILEVKRNAHLDHPPQTVLESKQNVIKTCVKFPTLSADQECVQTYSSSGHHDKSWIVKKKFVDCDQMRRVSNCSSIHAKFEPVTEKTFNVSETKTRKLNEELNFEPFKNKKALSRSSNDENTHWYHISAQQRQHSVIYLTNRGATLNIPKQIPLNPRESFLIQQQPLIPDKNKYIVKKECSSILKNFKQQPSVASGVYLHILLNLLFNIF